MDSAPLSGHGVRRFNNDVYLMKLISNSLRFCTACGPLFEVRAGTEALPLRLQPIRYEDVRGLDQIRFTIANACWRLQGAGGHKVAPLV